jgi:hypothetical protein
MNSTTSFFTKSNNEPLNLQRFIIPAEEITTGGAPALSYLFGTSHSQQNNFEQMTFADICNTAREPFNLDKELAPIFLPSTATAKKKETVLAADSMTALVADLDNGNLELSAIERVLQAALVESYCVYSTKSATAENRRWRVVVPILDAIPCRQWQDMQTALSGLFGSAADDCMRKVTQISYLPNRGEYYKHSERDGFPLDCNDTCHQLVIKSLEIMQQREHTEQLREQVAKPAQRNFSPANGSTIAAYNEAYSIPDLLAQYGYKKRAGGKWLHPESTSGIAGVKLLDGRYFSHHSTDQLADGHTHDAFDLFVCHEHGGDVDAALKAAGNVLVNSNGVTINKHNQREYMQQREQTLITEALTQPATSLPSNEKTTREALDLSDVNLAQPHGLAGLMVNHMRDMADRELTMSYPAFALQVLSVLSLGRKGYDNTKMNLITLVIAETASGKNVGQAFIKQVLRNLNMGHMMRGSVRSDKDVISNLVESEGKDFYILDEVHSLFNSMTSKNAESYQSNIGPLMLQLATESVYSLSGNHQREFREKTEKLLCKIEAQLTADKKPNDDLINTLEKTKKKLERQLDKINNGFPDVGFSLAGCSTPSNLDKIASPDNIESGLIGRSLLFRCDEGVNPLKDHVENSARWMEILSRLGNISRGSFHQITATPESKSDLMTIRHFYDRPYYRKHPQLGPMYRRLYERVKTVASVLAVESGEITPSDVRYALKVVLRHIDDAGYLARKNEAESIMGDESEFAATLTETAKRFLKDDEDKYLSMLKNKLKSSSKKLKVAMADARKNQKPDPLDGFISKLVADGVLFISDDGKKCRLA